MADKITILIAAFDKEREEVLTEQLNAGADMEVVGSTASGCDIPALAAEYESSVILMYIDEDTFSDRIETVEQLLQEKPMENIIFYSAQASDEMIRSAMGAGARDFLIQDCGQENLLKHIRAAAEGHPVLEERVYNIVMQEYIRLQKSEKSLMFFINNISKLTGTERELLKLLMDGYKVNEIPGVRCVESSTVKTQIKGLLHKFGCSRTKEIVQMMQELKIEHLL